MILKIYGNSGDCSPIYPLPLTSDLDVRPASLESSHDFKKFRANRDGGSPRPRLSSKWLPQRSTSHLDLRRSHLPPPFNLFMNVQLILIGGGGPRAVAGSQPTIDQISQRERFVGGNKIIGGPVRSQSTFEIASVVHDLFTLRSRWFTLFHALLRYFVGGEGASAPSAAIFDAPPRPSLFASTLNCRRPFLPARRAAAFALC